MEAHSKIDENKIGRIFQEFTGEIYQKPPLRSSVKREVRKRFVYSIDMLDVKENLVLFRVACQAGTYIRKLCSDIGDATGEGAHMRELRRTRSGSFVESDNLSSFYDVLNAQEKLQNEGDETPLKKLVRPLEDAFRYVPKIFVKDTAADAICHGASLAAPGISMIESDIEPNDSVVLFTLKGETIALAKALLSTKDILEAEKGLVCRTNRVIMAPGTYPSTWKKRTIS